MLHSRAMAEVEVVGLAGRTSFLPLEDSVGALRQRVSVHEGVPAELLRLTCAGRELSNDAVQLEDGSLDCPVRVLLRLEGGKGGFGAMLRTAGAKGIKTTNFDACRDLNGRRLRHVNAEAKLREWEEKAEERKLKKQQELASKPSKEPMIERFDDDEYEEQLEARSRPRFPRPCCSSPAMRAATSRHVGKCSSPPLLC